MPGAEGEQPAAALLLRQGDESKTISDLDPANMRTVTVERDSAMRYLRLTFGMGP
jgi:hypothetical protein